MAFTSDDFTGTAGTELHAYSAAWTKQNASGPDNGNIFLGFDSGSYATTNDTTHAIYQRSGTPASPDYSVSAIFTRTAGIPGTALMGLIGRAAAAGTSSFYQAMYVESVPEFRLLVMNAGS